MKQFLTRLGFRFGTSRMVLLFGKYVIKMPKINSWKFFLKGILANLDENMWYKHSPSHWQLKMSPTLHCFLGGIVLIAIKAKEITDEEFDRLEKSDYEPLPVDFKRVNFGKLDNRFVLVDYADTRYWCGDCEKILCHKKECK